MLLVYMLLTTNCTSLLLIQLEKDTFSDQAEDLQIRTTLHIAVIYTYS